MAIDEGDRPDEDRDLVERARAGDRDAFGQLVRKYQHRVVNMSRALVWNAADAEDVAQEAFVRAYRGLAAFRGASRFRTWLYRIVTNAARTHLARGAAGHELGDEHGAAVERAVSPEDVEQKIIDRDRLDRALAALPAELRETVVLRDVEGLEYREIATALDVPIGTVESRIFRGRARLRRLVTDHWNGDDRDA